MKSSKFRDIKFEIGSGLREIDQIKTAKSCAEYAIWGETVMKRETSRISIIYITKFNGQGGRITMIFLVTVTVSQISYIVILDMNYDEIKKN